MVVQAALESAVKEFDNVVAFKFRDLSLTIAVLHQESNNVSAVYSCSISTVNSSKARIGLKVGYSGQVLSLSLDVLLLFSYHQKNFTEFGFQLAAKSIKVVSFGHLFLYVPSSVSMQ